jgi:hypothetical protein
MVVLPEPSVVWDAGGHRIAYIDSKLRWRPGARAGVRLPSAAEIRASSLNRAFISRKAKRELGWTTSPHEDCLEATIAWYRDRDPELARAAGARQPRALRLASAVTRRLGL